MSTFDRPPIPPHGIRCRGECGAWYPPEAVPFMFSTERGLIRNAVHVRRYGPLEWKRVCNSCLQNRQDRRKREGNGRLRDKARKAVERHRVTFSSWVGHEITADQMRSEYLYDLDQIVHDMEHALKNGCYWCHDLYARMGHGPADITLDVDDPRKHRAERSVPVYGHESHLCCRSCNSKKRDLTPDQWKQVCVSFRRRRAFQTELNLRPAEGKVVRLDFFEAIGCGRSVRTAG